MRNLYVFCYIVSILICMCKGRINFEQTFMWTHAPDWDGYVFTENKLNTPNEGRYSKLHCASLCETNKCDYFFYSKHLCQLHSGKLEFIGHYPSEKRTPKDGAECYLRKTCPQVMHQSLQRTTYTAYVNETGTFNDVSQFCESRGAKLAMLKDRQSLGAAKVAIEKHTQGFTDHAYQQLAFYVAFKFSYKCHNFLSTTDNTLLAYDSEVWALEEPRTILAHGSHDQGSDCVIIKGMDRFTGLDDFTCEAQGLHPLCEN